MITTRRSNERGHADHGWLKSKHTFSFAGYFDKDHMGFRNLRVINDDLVAPTMGFGMHGHEDMEIFSYAVKGQLTHRDSMGNQRTIGRGEVQFMSAGSGVRHSEFNPSDTEQTHLLQIWILPDGKGYEPRYEDKDFTEALETGELVALLTPDGKDESIKIGADAEVFAAWPKEGKEFEISADTDRGYWIQVVDGNLRVNDTEVGPGDAISAEDISKLSIKALTDAEFILFSLGG